MSVAEMKIKAIEQITNLKTEGAVKELLEYLQKLNEKEALNLSVHYDTIKGQYGDVLKKLAE